MVGSFVLPSLFFLPCSSCVCLLCSVAIAAVLLAFVFCVSSTRCRSEEEFCRNCFPHHKSQSATWRQTKPSGPIAQPHFGFLLFLVAQEKRCLPSICATTRTNSKQPTPLCSACCFPSIEPVAGASLFDGNLASFFHASPFKHPPAHFPKSTPSPTPNWFPKRGFACLLSFFRFFLLFFSFFLFLSFPFFLSFASKHWMASSKAAPSV